LREKMNTVTVNGTHHTYGSPREARAQAKRWLADSVRSQARRNDPHDWRQAGGKGTRPGEHDHLTVETNTRTLRVMGDAGGSVSVYEEGRHGEPGRLWSNDELDAELTPTPTAEVQPPRADPPSRGGAPPTSNADRAVAGADARGMGAGEGDFGPDDFVVGDRVSARTGQVGTVTDIRPDGLRVTFDGTEDHRLSWLDIEDNLDGGDDDEFAAEEAAAAVGDARRIVAAENARAAPDDRPSFDPPPSAYDSWAASNGLPRTVNVGGDELPADTPGGLAAQMSGFDDDDLVFLARDQTPAGDAARAELARRRADASGPPPLHRR